MDRKKQKRLEAAGWQVGSTAHCLELTPEDEQLVEMRISLSAKLREVRQRWLWTQTVLARRLGSSQSRVAKMEAGDRSVSLDLLIRGLFAAGASPRDIGRALASSAA
ncbi:MAG TPA: helix-turn-helix transcriptional regulator [Gemmatimonadaceae bacterium]|jgi:Predicted transcriptional regulator with C-terminal CBS domains